MTLKPKRREARYSMREIAEAWDNSLAGPHDYEPPYSKEAATFIATFETGDLAKKLKTALRRIDRRREKGKAK